MADPEPNRLEANPVSSPSIPSKEEAHAEGHHFLGKLSFPKALTQASFSALLSPSSTRQAPRKLTSISTSEDPHLTSSSHVFRSETSFILTELQEESPKVANLPRTSASSTTLAPLFEVTKPTETRVAHLPHQPAPTSSR